MIITQTPFRMSFFGGGTDFPGYFRDNPGAVIATTFDKYCYVNVRHLPRFFDYSSELTYSKTERVSSIDEIEHPLIREAMRDLKMHEIRLIYEADLPSRSGLGTSSSFAVGMLLAFHALKSEHVGSQELADSAIRLERVLCNEAGGWQDQIAVAFGGLNRIDFAGDGYTVSPIVCSDERKAELDSNLMLFFTGFSRFSADIQRETVASLGANAGTLAEMYGIVNRAQEILVSRETPLLEFGKLLDETWQLKKSLNSQVTNDRVDQIYARACSAGAAGGKLLGAGNGGFLLFYAEPDARASVRAALSDLLEVPFSFEGQGPRILYYAPEKYEAR